MKQLSLESLESRHVLATLIAGQVVDDLNGNGVIEEGEPGQAAVTVYVDANGNDMLDIDGDIVEPDDYADGEIIDASALGVSLSVVDENNVGVDGEPAVIARVDAFASTGSQVFAYDVEFFNHFFRLRADFDTPASSVQINFTGTRPFAGDVGLLEAYSADGTLIDSFETGELLEFQYETMLVSSDQANIAYINAFTERANGLTGRIDSLRINSIDSELWTLTDADGDYSLAVSESGTYRINEVIPPNFVQTVPSGDGGQDVVIEVGQTVEDIDFANTSTGEGSWQNPLNPLDVDGDGTVSPVDALLIINELNLPEYRDPTTGLLPPPPANIPAYFDVDGDGFAVATDAILVINFLNSDLNGAGAVAAEGEPTVGVSGAVAAAVETSMTSTVTRSSSEARDHQDASGTADLGQVDVRLLEVQQVESVFGNEELGELIGAALSSNDDSIDNDTPTSLLPN